MFMNYAYLNNFVPALHDDSRPLIISSCGTYRLDEQDERPVFTTDRPKGRVDYQLLYIAAGKAHFYFRDTVPQPPDTTGLSRELLQAAESIEAKEREEIVSAGHMILYCPREMQKYRYYAEDQTEVFWVHFTGNSVQNILEEYELPATGHVFYTGTSPDYPWLFRQMIQELQMCRPNYEELLPLLLRHILLLANRQIKETNPSGCFMLTEINQAAQYFREHYHAPISIDAYAASRHISTCWFIRKFKEYMGVTPMQYILSVRIANAQNLLETTSYSITEISALVGYDNPLYFSRLFRSQLGMSPTEYRKNQKQET